MEWKFAHFFLWKMLKLGQFFIIFLLSRPSQLSYENIVVDVMTSHV